jgi:hypothetical protein
MGELQLLPIPTEQWDTISMDFIVELLEAHRYDVAMIMVNSAGKCRYFILTHTTIKVSRAAQLFLNKVWKLHRLPWNIIFNQGLQFISEFMRELYCLLRIKLSASMVYHPQPDASEAYLTFT